MGFASRRKTGRPCDDVTICDRRLAAALFGAILLSEDACRFHLLMTWNSWSLALVCGKHVVDAVAERIASEI